MLERVRGVVKANRQTPAGKLVLALNPITSSSAPGLYTRLLTPPDADSRVERSRW